MGSFKPKGLIRGKFFVIWPMLLTFGIYPTCVLSAEKGFGHLSWPYFDSYQGNFIASALQRLVNSVGSDPSAYTHKGDSGNELPRN